MPNIQETDIQEAKVISLPKRNIAAPQIPDQPSHQGILQLHTLEYLDHLLDEHFE